MALDLWIVFEIKNISWQGMMHACSAFDPGIYSANIVMDILSHTPPVI